MQNIIQISRQIDITFIVTVKVELSNAIDMVFRQNYFDAEIQQCCLEMSRNQASGCTGPLYSTLLTILCKNDEIETI